MLLIVAIIGSSAYIYAFLLNALLRRQPAAGSAANYASVMLIGVVLPLLVATILLWLFPHWLIRKRGMLALNSEALAGIRTALDELCVRAGIMKRPVFLWNPLDTSDNGFAFGRPGRMYVYLSGGLIAGFTKERAAFEAVLLHELAHVRNRDVSKTYFTIASFYAFLITSIPPLLYSMVGTSLSTNLHVAGSAIFLGIMVYFIRNSVLRAREYYADLRASTYKPATDGLRLQLRKGRQVNFWQARLGTHPDPHRRLAMLDDPIPLFRMSVSEALVTGIATTFAMFSLFFLTAEIVQSAGLELSGLVFFVVALLLAPLAVMVVSIGIWRMSFVALMREEQTRGTGRLGIGLGLGMAVGVLVSLVNPLLSRFAGVVTLSSALIWMVLLVVTLLLFGGFCRWIATGARSWLAIALYRSSPRPLYLLGLALVGIAGLAIFLFFVLAFGVGLTSQGGQFTLAQTLRFLPRVALFSPLTTLTLLSIWAYPLVAAFLPRQKAGSQWAFLDPMPDGIGLPRALPLQPGWAIAIGVGCGSLGLGLLLLVHAIFRPEGIIFIVTTIACITSVAAIGSALLARNLAWLHGLCAAQMAGILCVLAFAVGLNGGGEFLPITILNGSTTLAALVAAVCAFFARAVRRNTNSISSGAVV
jgi:Zn-dependent protease with chaperone function